MRDIELIVKIPVSEGLPKKGKQILCCKEGYRYFQTAIKAIESSRNIEEIEEVINCDADAETKCKMISNILMNERWKRRNER